MNTELLFTDADFIAYFREMYGYEPFLWQAELCRKVLADRRWPDTLSLPTAAGKTAVLDIALFFLAAQAPLPPAERTAPRRMVFVVDRRVVVNATAERARFIHRRLAAAEDGVLSRLRAALLEYGGEEPLRVTELRGGVWKDERWARSPLQPAVIVSTVDQIGSRLLHRGYGLSPNAWPLHAGLLANDTMVILDEAHLSRPFTETLAAIRKFRAQGRRPLTLPFAVVTMSATPGVAPGEVFPDAEKSSLLTGDTALAPRLTRPKLVKTAEAGTNPVAAYADKAKDMAEKDGCDTVAVVVNTVDAARKVYARLSEGSNRANGEVILLTGRCRSFERDSLVKEYEGRLLSGRDRNGDAGKLFVVATQCIEAGADFDFDAIVTACCPLDCLRQRLGRLNRTGTLAEATAVVVGPENDKPDPLYGEATLKTWQLLQELHDGAADGVVDFAPLTVAARLPKDLGPYNAPAEAAPLMFPAYCNLWAQTNPAPYPTHDPAVFLHGASRATAEVQLVWRADLDPEKPGTWAEAVQSLPPLPAETLSVHLWVAKAWLSGKLGSRTPPETDIEGAAMTEEERAPATLPFLRWQGEETGLPQVDTGSIRPGDTLVLPAGRGGCDRFGWNPDSDTAVADIADGVRQTARRAPVLRLTAAVVGEKTMARFAQVFIAGDEDSIGYESGDLQAALAATAADVDAPHWLRDAAAAMAATESHPLARQRADGVWMVSGGAWSAEHGCFEDSERGSSVQRAPVTVTAHTVKVADMARRFAEILGLGEDMAATMHLAGLWHDQGKRDPRFQALLCGGSRTAAIKAELRLGDMLAKSAAPACGLLARAASGYPAGARHELLSARLAENAGAGGRDAALLLHLVASHHGRCRAFAPAVADPQPLTVECEVAGQKAAATTATGLEAPGSGVTDRFWQLVGDYNWWGLAFLESVFRLADHRVSENDAEQGEKA